MNNISFEWDEAKSRSNLRKHGVSFEDASRIFGDPLRFTTLDRIEDGEERWITFGVADRPTVLLVAHTIRSVDEAGIELIRIISARETTRRERLFYESENG